jgi:hypothetical protein
MYGIGIPDINHFAFNNTVCYNLVLQKKPDKTYAKSNPNRFCYRSALGLPCGIARLVVLCRQAVYARNFIHRGAARGLSLHHIRVDDNHLLMGSSEGEIEIFQK